MSKEDTVYMMSWDTQHSSATKQLSVKEIRAHAIIKELLREAKRLDAKVTFDKKRTWCLGTHSEDGIVVQLCDPFGTPFEIEDIVFILAHEIRHAQHVEQKLFKPYYKNKKKCSWQTGLAAERDCDRFATNFCKKHNLNSYLCQREYPGWKVNLAKPPRKWFREYMLIRYMYSDMIITKSDPWMTSHHWLLTKLSPKLYSNRAFAASVFKPGLQN